MSALVNIEEIRNSSCTTARTYNWDVFIRGGHGNGLSNSSKMINLRCESLDQPNPTTSVIDVNIRAFTYKEYGGVEWNELTFSVLEIDEYAILNQLYAHHITQFDYKTGYQVDKCQLEQTIDIVLQSIDLSAKASWHIEGAIMTGMTPPQLSNDKAGAWTGFSFTVAYDVATLIPASGNQPNPNRGGPAVQRALNGFSVEAGKAGARSGNSFASS